MQAIREQIANGVALWRRRPSRHARDAPMAPTCGPDRPAPEGIGRVVADIARSHRIQRVVGHVGADQRGLGQHLQCRHQGLYREDRQPGEQRHQRRRHRRHGHRGITSLGRQAAAEVAGRSATSDLRRRRRDQHLSDLSSSSSTARLSAATARTTGTSLANTHRGTRVGVVVAGQHAEQRVAASKRRSARSPTRHEPVAADLERHPEAARQCRPGHRVLGHRHQFRPASRFPTSTTQIKQEAAAGQSTADLEDQRNSALQDLASQMNVSYFTASNGDLQSLYRRPDRRWSIAPRTR